MFRLHFDAVGLRWLNFHCLRKINQYKFANLIINIISQEIHWTHLVLICHGEKSHSKRAINSATRKFAIWSRMKGFRSLQKREVHLEVAAITADKQLEISPKEEFSGNGAAGQKRGHAQRKLTAKGKKRARAHLRGLSKMPRPLAQRGERRETRSDGKRLREEKKNNKKENASSNSDRRAGREGRQKRREEGAIGACASKCRGGRRGASFSLSFLRSYLLLAHASAIPSVLSFSPSLFLSLSLSCRGNSVLQVVRPLIGGRGRRCAWVGEAWCPPPIGYRFLPIPEVGRWSRKEGRNEGGRS